MYVILKWQINGVDLKIFDCSREFLKASMLHVCRRSRNSSSKSELQSENFTLSRLPNREGKKSRDIRSGNLSTV